MDEITKIKAELYDLQYHNCNGGLSLSTPDMYDDKLPFTIKGCTYCNKIIELQNELRSLLGNKSDEYQSFN